MAEVQIAVRRRCKAENGWRIDPRRSSLYSTSCPAKAGRPVNAGQEIYHTRTRLLDRPLSRTMTAAYVARQCNKPMTTFLHTDADLQAGLAQLDDRRSSPAARRRQGRRLQPAPARGGFPRPLRASCADSNFRPQAPPPSAAGCSPHLIRFIMTRCAARATDKLKRLGLSARQDQVDQAKSARLSPRATSISTRSATWRPISAHGALTALHGIGPWTADIYLLFCLGHADAFPAGDLAVAGSRAHRLRLAQAAGRQGPDQNGRGLAALARRGGASALGLLSRGKETRCGAGSAKQPA